MPTREGNKIIAEFDGYKVHEWTYSDGSKGILRHTNNSDYKEIIYNEDWNDLMSVVEKIEKEYWVTVTNQGNWYDISICYPKNPYTVIVRQKGENKIERVWAVIVDFIEWYNQNK